MKKDKKTKQGDQLIQIDTSSTPGGEAEPTEEIQVIQCNQQPIQLDPITLQWTSLPPQPKDLTKGNEYRQFEQRYRLFAFAPSVTPPFMDFTRLIYCQRIKGVERILQSWDAGLAYNTSNPYFINLESGYSYNNFFDMWWSDPYAFYFRIEYWGAGVRQHTQDQPPDFPLVNALLCGAWFSDSNNSFNQTVSDWQNPISCQKLIFQYDTTSTSTVHERVRIQLIFDVSTTYETDFIQQQRDAFLKQKETTKQLNGQLSTFFSVAQAVEYPSEYNAKIQRFVDHRIGQYTNITPAQQKIVEMVVRTTRLPDIVIPDNFYPEIFQIAATQEKYAPFDGKPYHFQDQYVETRDPERVRFADNIMRNHDNILASMKSGNLTYTNAVQNAYKQALGNYTAYGYNTDYNDPNVLDYMLAAPGIRYLYPPFSQKDFRTERGATFFQNLIAEGKNATEGQLAVLALEKAGKFAAVSATNVVAGVVTKVLLTGAAAGIGLTGGAIVPVLLGADYLASYTTGYGASSSIATALAMGGQTAIGALISPNNAYVEAYSKYLAGLSDSSLDFGQEAILRAHTQAVKAEWNGQQNRIFNGLDILEAPAGDLRLADVTNDLLDTLSTSSNVQEFYKHFLGDEPNRESWQKGRELFQKMLTTASPYEAKLIKKVLHDQAVHYTDTRSFSFDPNNVLSSLKGMDSFKVKAYKAFTAVTDNRIINNPLTRAVSKHPVVAGVVLSGALALANAYRASQDQSQFSGRDDALTAAIIKREQLLESPEPNNYNQIILYEKALLEQKDPLALSKMLVDLNQGTSPYSEIRATIQKLKPQYTYISTFRGGSRRQAKLDRKNKREWEELVRFKILLKQLAAINKQQEYNKLNMNKSFLGKRVVRK